MRDPRVYDPWIRECIGRHYKRYDFVHLMADFGCPGGFYGPIDEYNRMVFRIGEHIVDSITSRHLDLKPVVIRERTDGPTGKVRLIGRESALQQIYDMALRGASAEIWKRRIAPQQCSSIPKRGPVYGVRMIQGWIKHDNAKIEYCTRHGYRYTSDCKYHGKLDAAKCFQHGDRNKFMNKLEHDCANEDLLWLWNAILVTHETDGYSGFMIGALTSEWAMQYLMSFAYRDLMGLHNRRGAQLIKHSLWYMDDVTVTGSSKKDMVRALDHITDYCAREIGQAIKPDWHLQTLDDHPIDTMGFLIYRSGKVAIRDRDFVRIRRMLLRSEPDGLTARQAKRVMSYKGCIDHSSNTRIYKNYHPHVVYTRARGAMRKEIRREKERNKNAEN